MTRDTSPPKFDITRVIATISKFDAVMRQTVGVQPRGNPTQVLVLACLNWGLGASIEAAMAAGTLHQTERNNKLLASIYGQTATELEAIEAIADSIDVAKVKADPAYAQSVQQRAEAIHTSGFAIKSLVEGLEKVAKGADQCRDAQSARAALTALVTVS